ncbi:MAG TPA: 30S ribosomal protein S21 [Caldithrix abyssi]|uniref:Small ribosomal subunit protein bS21 n=1 Tax=Caldithrix abyssi TaxID=187145 RepID=A0A7V1PVD8_CALAY|nr:30S ribosomal protein S21 [Caldithrix abyssi]
MKIMVRNNDVDKALKILKRSLQKGGLYRELQRHAYYEKPSEVRKRQVKEARKKMRRAMKLNK